MQRDKIAESGLTSNELIYRTINVTVSMHVIGKFVNMLPVNEAANFLYERFNPDPEDDFGLLYQIIIDESFGDGVTAFVLATNFEKKTNITFCGIISGLF